MLEREIILERMTRPQVESALRDGYETITVACGAVEQHGPHLPLFVDAEIGTRLSYEIALKLGKALAAPTIRVGCSEHHMSFPGTLTVRESTFKDLCADYCMALSRHGFEHIFFVPSHGGNFKPIADSVDEWNEAAGPDCKVAAFTDLLSVVSLWRRLVEEKTGLGDRVGGHADIAESSLMLLLHPHLVNVEAAEIGHTEELSQDLVERIMRDGLKSITPNGVLGDARGMSVEIGELVAAETVTMMAEYFETIRDQ